MAGDDTYMHHMAVAAVSCVINTDKPIALYILSNGITDESKEKLVGDINTLNKGTQISFIDLDSAVFDGLKSEAHISPTMYARYLIPDYLPADAEKAIYMDTDVLVRHSVTDLYDIDISDYPVAAVREPRIESKYSVRYDIPVGTPVFNSGVLLINLKYWRETELGKKALEYSLKKGMNDQSTLNVLIRGNQLQLSPTWNCIKSYFREYYDFACSKERVAELKPIVKDPAIIHATGKRKIGDKSYPFPFREEFFRYLAMTSWKNYQPKDIGIFDTLLVNCRRTKIKIIDLIRK